MTFWIHILFGRNGRHTLLDLSLQSYTKEGGRSEVDYNIDALDKGLPRVIMNIQNVVNHIGEAQTNKFDKVSGDYPRFFDDVIEDRFGKRYTKYG